MRLPLSDKQPGAERSTQPIHSYLFPDFAPALAAVIVGYPYPRITTSQSVSYRFVLFHFRLS